MTRLAAALLAVAAFAGTARADLWQRAIEHPAEAARDRYEAAMSDGDELAKRANAANNTRRTVTQLVDQAIHAYELAAEARPQEGEPFFRIASVLESFFTECNIDLFARRGRPPPPTCPMQLNGIDLKRAAQALEAWDKFEARSPLDPRIAEALFSRAILRTKLVNTGQDARAHLEGALKDYTALLDRADGMTMLRLEQVWGNLAETYMMLDKLDEAIEAYRVAIDKGAGASTVYGEAVALDRDERGTEALQLVRSQGIQAFDDYRDDIATGAVFYVPKGEEFYYFGLIYEALGYYSDSIANWKLFIKSGAHPQFQARAKAHIDALSVKQQSQPRTRLPMDPFVAPYP